MPRYFFNIYDGEEIFDHTGAELRGSNEVCLHMMAMATEWIKRKERQETHWHLEARDEDENIIGCMRFGLEEEA